MEPRSQLNGNRLIFFRTPARAVHPLTNVYMSPAASEKGHKHMPKVLIKLNTCSYDILMRRTKVDEGHSPIHYCQQ